MGNFSRQWCSCASFRHNLGNCAELGRALPCDHSVSLEHVRHSDTCAVMRGAESFVSYEGFVWFSMNPRCRVKFSSSCVGTLISMPFSGCRVTFLGFQGVSGRPICASKGWSPGVRGWPFVALCTGLDFDPVFWLQGSVFWGRNPFGAVHVCLKRVFPWGPWVALRGQGG